MDPHFDGVIFQTHGAEMLRRLARPFPPYQVLDVREKTEFGQGHIPGALSVSADQLEIALPDGLDPKAELYVIGSAPGDPAVRQASLALLAHGAARIVELPGGMLEWSESGGQLSAA